MPKTPPSADPHCIETHTVYLYQTGGNSKTVWIDTASVEWLVAYICDEHYSHGVVADTNVAPCGAVKEANVPGLKDAHYWWDYQSQDWVGEFLPGHKCHGTTRRFGIDDLWG